jgi:basic membrane lipoprotein Med (substrate-binding protein (PBP1-ABC) superfamily)
VRLERRRRWRQHPEQRLGRLVQQRTRRRVQGLPGVRHRHGQRQVVQPVGLRRRDRGGRGQRRHDHRPVPAVGLADRLRAEHHLVHQPEVRDHRHRRLPDGRRDQKAAQANPDQKFAIVDFSYAKPLANVDALLFNTVEDGFQAGYLAAAMSKTHKVATFGGQKLPTVTIYMDGYWDGVQYYNQKHHANVQVLGWNEKTQNGSFTGNFTDLTAGQRLTTTFISEGADIIFPVAGNVGLGAAKAVQTADAAAGTQKVNMMWVDTDGCISAAQYCKYFITSVNKGITVAVKGAVESAQKGDFKGGNYVGTLANNGVGLAPFHDFESKIPASVKSELDQIKADIISGKIKPATKSPA